MGASSVRILTSSGPLELLDSVRTLDGNIMHTAGDESMTGIKTFVHDIIVSSTLKKNNINLLMKEDVEKNSSDYVQNGISSSFVEIPLYTLASNFTNGTGNEKFIEKDSGTSKLRFKNNGSYVAIYNLTFYVSDFGINILSFSIDAGTNTKKKIMTNTSNFSYSFSFSCNYEITSSPSNLSLHVKTNGATLNLTITDFSLNIVKIG